jgi:hunchback-like protein
MVLNPDGTPNPLPIIDVYGTRRGPKMKKAPPQVSNEVALSNISSSNSNGSSLGEESEKTIDSPSPPPPQRDQIIMSTPPLKRFASDTSDSDNETRRHRRAEGPMSPITPPSAALHSIDHTKAPPPLLGPKNPLELYAVALNQYLFTNPLLHLSSGVGSPEMVQLAQEQQGQLLSQFLQNQSGPSPRLSAANVRMIQNNNYNAHPHQTPLDLRQAVVGGKVEAEELKRRKRKGKALRYERQAEETQALDFSNNNNNNSRQRQDLNAVKLESPGSRPTMCKYCEISFPDHVLYSMHMSYHSGDRDPFHCKSCGKKTQDKVSFFLHLTTDSH